MRIGNAATEGTLLLVGALLFTGCKTCLEIEDMSSVPPTQQITRKHVVFKAAVLPSGSPSTVSVEDYTLPQGDGVNEIKVGWSQTNTGAAEYASINFPAAEFGDGPARVDVTAFHYNKCRLEGYDKNGAAVANADHAGGQRTEQTLRLSDGRIARIDVVGAEIGITELCYWKWWPW